MLKIVNRIKEHFDRDSFFYRMCRAVYIALIKVFSVHGYIRQYVIFPIEAFGRKHHLWPFYDKNARFLESMRDKHKGKRCFIIATGPSLRVEDVEKLKDEVTIGVNSLYRLYEKTDYRPTYYAVLDPVVQDNVDSNMDKYNSISTDNVFFGALHKSKRNGIIYVPLCYQNHWHNIDNQNFDYAKNLKYNIDLVWGLYDKYTITNIAIELAIYMGCKEIYLLGVDCNFTGPSIHFDKTDNSDNVNKEIGYYLQKAMMTGYRFMEKETKKRGVHIFNATRGGMLDEFDRVDFDSLFNNDGGLTK